MDGESKGLDLEQGIAIAELADGAMLAGRVGSEDVLLARRGDAYFALDAHCTHYHGPLAEGALVGETVRCPWHHACFDLRTGSAVGAPAMKALKVYETVVEGDRVRVKREGALRAAPAVRMSDAPSHVVIVGAGAAGSFAAAELRRIGFAGRVTLLSREDRRPYDKPNLSKDYLAGRAQQEWIPLRAEDEYAGDRIDLRLGTTVQSIDAVRSEVHLTDGGGVQFDRLILATGATPRRLSVRTADDARIAYLRTWADADALLRQVSDARNVVIIGTGFIGLEAAASLRERDLQVVVVGREERPLEKVLGSALGDFVRRTHEKHGVRFLTGRMPAEIHRDRVVLDDGTVEPADLVLVAIGVEPDVALARAAGLTIDRGVIVDDRLRTSSPNIFAAGDAARFPDPRTGQPIRVEHWVVAGRLGQTAARNALGLDERFGSIPFFWSQHYDLVLAYVGHAPHVNEVEIFGSFDDTNAAAVYRDRGRVAAVVTLFRDDVSLAVEAAMERGDSDDAILDIVRGAF